MHYLRVLIFCGVWSTLSWAATPVDAQSADGLPATCILHLHANGGFGQTEATDILVTNTDATFSALQSASPKGVEVTVVDWSYVNFYMEGLYAQLVFPVPTAELTAQIPPGDYTAQRPHGILFSGLESPVRYPTTRWQILAAEYDDNGQPIQLAIDFQAQNAEGATVLFGQIRYHSDLPLPGTVQFASESFRGDRSANGIVVSVNRVGSSSYPASLSYYTDNYTAVEGVDYTAKTGQLTWAAGDARPKEFTVPVLHDPASGNHVFFVRLQGQDVGAMSTAAVTIVDNRLPAASSLPEPNGSLDFSYPLVLSSSDEVTLNCITPLPDGSAVIGGNFVLVNGATQAGVIRLNAQGSPDPAFQSPLSDTSQTIHSIVAQPDGKLLLAGAFQLQGETNYSGLCRLTAEGAVDPTFKPDPELGLPASGNGFEVNSMVLQPDGRIVIAGELNVRGGLARLNSDGSLDTTFNPPAFDYDHQYDFVLLQPDGRLIVSALSMLSRLQADGSVDPSFRSAIQWNQAVLDANGSLLFVPDSAGIELGPLARENNFGSLDSAFLFDPAVIKPQVSVSCVAVQPDGKLLVGLVQETGRANQGVPGIVRLRVDGGLDPTFRLSADVPKLVGAMALQADGGLIVSTGYLSPDTKSVVHTVLARLRPVQPGDGKPH